MCIPGLVSVIIPVYNVEKYLARCVNSVLNQTYTNLEIILVNDGSVDGSLEICRMFAAKDSRVVVVSRDNGGPSAARNTGLDLAQGEWLCFVDGDDYADLRFVDVLLTAALKNNALSVRCRQKISFSDNVGSAVEIIGSAELFKWRDYLLYIQCAEGYGVQYVCAGIYHRALFKNIRFNALSFYGSEATVSKMVYQAKTGLFALIADSLYFFYQRPDGLSNNIKGGTWLNYIPESLDTAEFWKQNNEPELYNISRQKYYHCVVNGIFYCQRDIPRSYGQFSYLYDEVKNAADKCEDLFCGALTIPAGAQNALANIIAYKTKLIVYGLGYNCMGSFLPWLEYFGLKPIEIWDRRAGKDETYKGIPFRAPNAEQDKDALILITLNESYITLSIQTMLREMGYRNFIRFPVISGALKYARFKKFLPGLLD